MVPVYAFVHEGLCICACGGQKSVSDVVPQTLSTLFFEIRTFIGLMLRKDDLAGHETPEIVLSPHQRGDYRLTPP